eukprot:3207192-Pleurochrysis_carterae.AAC.1
MRGGGSGRERNASKAADRVKELVSRMVRLVDRSLRRSVRTAVSHVRRRVQTLGALLIRSALVSSFCPGGALEPGSDKLSMDALANLLMKAKISVCRLVRRASLVNPEPERAGDGADAGTDRSPKLGVVGESSLESGGASLRRSRWAAANQ